MCPHLSRRRAVPNGLLPPVEAEVVEILERDGHLEMKVALAARAIVTVAADGCDVHLGDEVVLSGTVRVEPLRHEEPALRPPVPGRPSRGLSGRITRRSERRKG